MPNYSKGNTANYSRNLMNYNQVFQSTQINFTPDKPAYPWKPTEYVLSNYDMSGKVSVNSSFNPQIQYSGLKWV